ncbi:C-terminal processing peptidase [Paramagnetospirillum caucaseum]|uniref:C-terminal processing peptidase n=2 Tax=Paramagnetospirillum caucaseum TaxID=1244869 RepID=M2YAL3_9PROT|nr:C-terminal processing peptidase [Paramagnetospirillum caucaseum]
MGAGFALALCLLSHPAAAGWVAGEAERTIAFGFDAIVERHLQPVTAQTIALDGLRGLAEIDPQLAVALEQGRLRLSTTEKVVADYPAAPPDDAVGWARITVNAALEASQVSGRLREADSERLYQAVFEGALGKADLFSRYAGAREAREHRSNRSGFGGIGIKFDLIDGDARIVEVVDDGPAAKLGLRAGDVITAIDGEPVKGLDRGELSARLRGAVATEVLVALRRDSQMLQFTLRRSLIVPQTVTTAINGGIAHFKITSFNQRTAYSLENQLKDVRTRLGAGLQGVVLDLRGNPGGLLDKAVAVVDLFLAEGTIISTRGRHPAAANSFEAKPGDIGEDLPLVVLVDGRSASAAEIVASALQDSGRAVVIGTNSYGKGTVQTVVRLPNDGEITLTWSRFHAPSGYALHGLGVLPALCSGGTTQSAAQMVEGAGRGILPGKPAETLAVWRGTGIDDIELRHRLRETCPPSRRVDGKLEMDLADRLLANRSAHARALAASAPSRGLEALQTRPSPETGSH